MQFTSTTTFPQASQSAQLLFPALVAGSSRAEQVLNGLPQPLLVCQADRRLLFVNRGAERLFADTLARQAGQRLMAIGQLEAVKLEELLRLACADSATQAGLWFSPNLQTGWLHVCTLSPAIARAADWPGGCLLLTVQLDRPGLAQSARIDALCQQCRLTNTERYVLMLLADGQAVNAAAHQLGLQVSTLRTHVRNLLGKTQARSLMQLLRWLGSAGPIFG
ncbi:helix-turn-helix transcriptional regulator [Roseateles violae]|uniref:Helix-turn-helix transcriptional regulator n=1 Tax=Roseateles violae TaxID=3058042 RepID=A0ABT8DYI7_9BURK|nr:helix-turn-helix transcriptional regulator [Pelomonas sp. PFR6]MDN3922645.1 helix-turn-helix transcriptional regulator [Pelomonas sp. PFR6]